MNTNFHEFFEEKRHSRRFLGNVLCVFVFVACTVFGGIFAVPANAEDAENCRTCALGQAMSKVPRELPKADKEELLNLIESDEAFLAALAALFEEKRKEREESLKRIPMVMQIARELQSPLCAMSEEELMAEMKARIVEETQKEMALWERLQEKIPEDFKRGFVFVVEHPWTEFGRQKDFEKQSEDYHAGFFAGIDFVGKLLLQAVAKEQGKK